MSEHEAREWNPIRDRSKGKWVGIGRGIASSTFLFNPQVFHTWIWAENRLRRPKPKPDLMMPDGADFNIRVAT